MIYVDQKAPDFTLPSDKGVPFTLSQLQGRPVVLYFYPKDNTSGCTSQACQFKDKFQSFLDFEASILGVSKDSISSHLSFSKKFDLPFPLLSDEDGTVCEKYGVWAEKSMYGRSYFGIVRTTILVNRAGFISHIWPKVKIPSHADDVLNVLKSSL